MPSVPAGKIHVTSGAHVPLQVLAGGEVLQTKPTNILWYANSLPGKFRQTLGVLLNICHPSCVLLRLLQLRLRLRRPLLQLRGLLLLSAFGSAFRIHPLVSQGLRSEAPQEPRFLGGELRQHIAQGSICPPSELMENPAQQSPLQG